MAWDDITGNTMSTDQGDRELKPAHAEQRAEWFWRFTTPLAATVLSASRGKKPLQKGLVCMARLCQQERRSVHADSAW